MLRRLATFFKRVAVLAVVVALVIGYLSSGFGPRPSEEASSQNAATSEALHPPSYRLAESIARLDQTMATVWTDQEVDVAPPADWLTVSRRLSLALVGSGLPLEEIRMLQTIPQDQRIEFQLNHLLADPRHHDYWSERWTRAFVGAAEGPFITYRRRRFRSWLSDAIAANRGIDEIVREMVTARGLATDRPEVNFLTVTMDSDDNGQPDPIRLAARTSRAFLGLRIDCVQCHDDFLGNVSLGDAGGLQRGTQQDFHSLAAFYSPARFNGLQGVRDDEHPYKYQYLHATEETEVEPAVPFARDLLPAEGPYRQRLAKWITHPENRQFSLTIVGRIWALMFGRPIGTAVDDLRLDEPPHPAIAMLADELVASGFDVRHIARTIAGSRVFRLDSEADFEITQRHESAWSVFPLVRLRPEQVAASVIQAARVKTVDRDSSLIVQLQKFGGMNDFVTRYGDIGEDEFDQETVTITQRLLMLNGELVQEYGKGDPLLNATTHINLFARSDAQAIDNVYLCVLNRYPSPEEKTVFVDRLESSRKTEDDAPDASGEPVTKVGLINPLARGDRERSIEDLFWVLANSSEFSWNH